MRPLQWGANSLMCQLSEKAPKLKCLLMKKKSLLPIICCSKLINWTNMHQIQEHIGPLVIGEYFEDYGDA